MNGSVKSISGNTLVVTDDAGKDTTFTLDAQTKLTLNGDPSTPAGISPGSHVTVKADGAKVKSVEVTS